MEDEAVLLKEAVLALLWVLQLLVILLMLMRRRLRTRLGTHPNKSEVILSSAVMYAARMIVGAAADDVVVAIYC